MVNTPAFSGFARYWLGVVVLVGIATCAPAYLSDSWMISCIGDEWAIYQRAKQIALGELSIPQEIFGPLSKGMWGVHKPFLTFCQGMGLRLFGINNVGWRMTSITSFALSIPALFIIARALVSTRGALLASALMTSSYFLLAESLWGYGWTLLRFFGLWTTAALVLFLQGPSLLAGAFLGLMLSLCSLCGALCAYIPPLAMMILLGFCWRMRDTRAYRGCAIVVLAFLFTNTVPIHIWSHTDDLKTTLRLTLMKTNLGPLLQNYFGAEVFPRVEGSMQTIPDFLKLFWSRFGETLLAPATYQGHSHYVFGRLNDPVVGILSLIGLGCSTFLALSSVRWRLVLCFYLPAVILSGALSPYPQPAITRIHFLVPFWSLFAALACDIVGRRVPAFIANLLFLSIFVFSATWSYDRLIVKLPWTTRFTKQAYAVELVQAFPDKKVVFLFAEWHPLEFVLEPYGLKERVVVGNLRTSLDILESVAVDPSAVVVLSPESTTKTVEMVSSRMCSQTSDSSCGCKPCGGLQPHHLLICGTVKCPELQSQKTP